jgi:hypothetical protein
MRYVTRVAADRPSDRGNRRRIGVLLLDPLAYTAYPGATQPPRIGRIEFGVSAACYAGNFFFV